MAMRKSVEAPPEDRRRRFSVQLRESEYNRLRYQARTKGVSMGRYLITHGLQPPVEQVHPEELRELLKELRLLCRQVQGEATNINQIAHWANSQQSFPGEAERVARDLRTQVNEICDLRLRLSELL